MARGTTAEAGTTRVAPNGYHYTKVEDRGWVLTHWLIMEEKLGRLIDPSTEQVRFKEPRVKRKLAETGTCHVNGLVLVKRRSSSLRARKAIIEHKIEELQAELRSINKILGED